MFYEDRARVIGKRIKENWKRLKLTQTELLAKVYLSEKSVASLRKWERGERLPDLTTLARMAELFECDIGYLLGDYDESDFSAHKVCEYTGLSERAIDVLHNLKVSGFGPVIVSMSGTKSRTTLQILDRLIVSEKFSDMFNELGYYLMDGTSISGKCQESIPNNFFGVRAWIEQKGYKIEQQSKISEMHLQTAADMFKGVFRELLKEESTNNG